jgi:hypothetical protein
VDLSERRQDQLSRHPWEVARFNFFLSLLAQHGAMTTKHWLDVGSGDAWFARSLHRELSGDARITCWDPNYTLDDVRDPANSVEGLELTIERPEGRFDGVLMLDVIEHVEDDSNFVRDIVKGSLSESGWMLVSVPAFQGLFSEHDTQLKHFRRYSPRQCRLLLESSGLIVEAEGGLFHSLLVPRIFRTLLERVHKPRATPDGLGEWSQGPALTRVLTSGLNLEGRVSLRLSRQRRLVVPGLSYWAFCWKSHQSSGSSRVD